MTTPAIDLTNAVAGSSAELTFYMHAYGAGMGTLNVIVNQDSTLFTHSGQLQPTASFPWAHIGIDLSAYVGQSISVSFSYGGGTSFTGDMAIDMVEVNACVSNPLPVLGCTDSTATNYDPTATVDDSSCVYPCLDNVVTVNMYNQYSSYSWNQSGGSAILVVSNGTSSDTLRKVVTGAVLSTDLCLVDDCWDVTFYDGGSGYLSEYSWDVTDTSGAILASGGGYPSGFSGASVTDAHSFAVGSAVCPVYGCTDPTALNYDSTATVDDGSCIAIVYGCTDSTAINYFPGANVDDGSCCLVAGCTDPTASNYDPNACIDDGSCIIGTTCSGSPITNLGVTNIIHNRATFTFDDMNSSTCRVDQLRIKYREVGTTAWSQKNMGSPTGYDPVTGICNSTSRTDKLVLGLSANTTYEWQMRVWYCSTGATAWVNGPNFTTLADCPNVGNLAVTTPTNTKATFTWDNSNGAYSFVRLQARVDTTGSSFFNIGGVGVLYGTYTKDKNGLVPGTTYRAKSRTWCDPNGGAYKAPSWTSFIYFTMPGSVRLDGGTSIESLDVYPNPSRDIFNVSFTSKEAQDLEVRVINVVGEVVYTEGLENFTGEYAKEIDLVKYTKGIYFLEITTDNGVINKKLILQ